MNKFVLSLLLLLNLVGAGVAEAQQPAKIPRIGYVSGSGNHLNHGPYVEAGVERTRLY
jgi:hypothetical protein